MSGNDKSGGGQGGGAKGPAQPTRSDAMNPNNAAYNPSCEQAKGGNPSADRAAAFNPQHPAYNPTTKGK